MCGLSVKEVNVSIMNCIKCVFKARERLFFSFFIINQYYMPKIFYYENVCSKQVECYFVVYSSLISTVRLMLCYKKCVFKASGNLLFSLLSYFFNVKNVCSKKAGTCFLVYWFTPLIQRICVQRKREHDF